MLAFPARLRPAPAALLATSLALAGCGDVPDPVDYGGGETGRAIAQCIERTERENNSITREQAGKVCTCLTERIAGGTERAMASGAVNRAEMERALDRCAADESVPLG